MFTWFQYSPLSWSRKRQHTHVIFPLYIGHKQQQPKIFVFTHPPADKKQLNQTSTTQQYLVQKSGVRQQQNTPYPFDIPALQLGHQQS